VEVVYRIKKANQTIAEKEELVFIEEELTYAQTLLVPITAFQGKYILEIFTRFGENSASEEHSFTIEFARPWIIFFVLIIFAVIALIYALKFRGRIGKIGEIDDAYSDFNPEKLKRKLGKK
jgi:hypothetical protein